MPANSAYLKAAVAALLSTAAPFPAVAQAPGNPPPPPGASNPPPPPANVCPRGTHWEEAGYISHGKYRPARCARDDGRE